MKRDCSSGTLKEIMCSIVCNRMPDNFGEPFIRSFESNMSGAQNIEAAAYICSLFLSCILTGFPTERMHIFVRYTREELSLFTFDCRMYDKLASEIAGESFTLLDETGNPVLKECSKQEIIESFDFFTNR